MDYQELIKPDIEDIEEMKEIKKDKTRIAVTIAIIILFVLFSIIAGIIRLSHTELVSGYNKPALEEFVQDVYADKINEKIGGDSNLTFDEITTIIANMVSQELSKTNMFTGPQLSEMETLIEQRINAAGPGTADPQVVKEITTLVEKQYETNYADMTEIHNQMKLLLATSETVSGERYEQLKKADEDVTAWLKEAQKGFDEKFRERDSELEKQAQQIEATMAELNKSIEEYNKKNAELTEKLAELDQAIADSNADTTSKSDVNGLANRIASLETALGKTEVVVQNIVNYEKINEINAALDDINKAITDYKEDTLIANGSQKESVSSVETLIQNIDRRLKDLEGFKKEVNEEMTAQSGQDALADQLYASKQDLIKLKGQLEELNTLVDGKENTKSVVKLIIAIQETISKLNETYAAKGDSYTKEDSDRKYALAGTSYTKAEVDSMLTQIGTTISGMSTSLDSMSTDVTNLKGAVYGKDGKASLQQQIDDLNTAYDNLNTLIQGVNNANSVIKRVEKLEALNLSQTLEGIQNNIIVALNGISGIQNYLNVTSYAEGVKYSKGDIVVHENKYYKSLVDNNTSNVSDTSAWKETDLNSRLVENAAETVNQINQVNVNIANKLGYGNYDAGVTYKEGAYVVYNEKIYVSKIDGNKGNTPDSSTAWAETNIATIMEDHITKIDNLTKNMTTLSKENIETALGLTDGNHVATTDDLKTMNGSITSIQNDYLTKQDFNNYKESLSTTNTTQKEKYKYSVSEYTENGETHHKLTITENQ